MANRVNQIFERLDMQLRQVLREGVLNAQKPLVLDVNACANILLALVEGRLRQYVRSNFKQSPVAQWDEQWALLRYSLSSKEITRSAAIA